MSNERKDDNLKGLPSELVQLLYFGPYDEDLQEQLENAMAKERNENKKANLFIDVILENYRRIYNQDNSSNYSIEEIIEIEDLSDWIFYGNEDDEENTSDKYRTRTKSGTNVKELPKALIIPTLENYQFAISLYQQGNAYLQYLDPEKANKLRYEKGKMYFEGALQSLSEAEIVNMQTNKGIEDLDLTFLRSIYSIMLYDFEKSENNQLKDKIDIYIPDLARYLGKRGNLNKKEIDELDKKFKSFHNILGNIKTMQNGKLMTNQYPVLNYEG